MIPLRSRLSSLTRSQPLAAIGLLVLLGWSIVAIGAVGDGGGWMGIGRYDPGEVFKIANVAFADARAAEALEGQPVDLSEDELKLLLSDPQVYGDQAADLGITEELSSYVEDQIEAGTLLDRLTSGPNAHLDAGGSRWAPAQRGITAINPQPLVLAALQRPSWDHWFGTNRAANDNYARIVNVAWAPLMIGFLGALFGVLGGAVLGWIQRTVPRQRADWLDGLVLGVYALPPVAVVVLISLSFRLAPIEYAAILAMFALVPAAQLVRESQSLSATLGPLIALFGSMMALLVLTEAAFSYVEGAWGTEIALGRQFVVHSPWTALFPGLALTSVAFGAHALGRGLQQVIQTRQASGAYDTT